MNPSVAGKAFEKSITNTLISTAIIENGWAYRLNDKLNFRSGFVSSPSPADHLYLHNDINLLIECKVVFGGDRFLLSRMSDKAIEYLRDFTNVSDKHLGLVAFSFWKPRDRGPMYFLPYWELLNNPKHIKHSEIRTNDRVLYMGPCGRPITGRRMDKLVQLRKDHNGS